MLFPFGGRMVGTSFRWRGAEFTITDGRIANGSAIHGFVLDRAWRVIAQSENRVMGEFHASIDDAALLDQWPSDFRIRMAYEVGPASLTCDIWIDNPDTTPMPYGFATHGYFRAPLAGGDGEACEVTVPAAATWVLDENAVPTGEIRPVDAENDLRNGPSIAGRQFNTVYTDLETNDDGESTARSAILTTAKPCESRQPAAFARWSFGTRPTAKQSRSSPTPAVPPPSTSKSAATLLDSASSNPANPTTSASSSTWWMMERYSAMKSSKP